ncbi:LAFE_0D12068g1_1 [Lachancea fermentati]|uniref:LAFE_0D12068g1_1 n=1 Tax=Lachancea fermentati TaxID=4955 RepID=A0A1G4MC43_LACFM|nr:LAFE_0D12068g1_1 [Lachancea fermentati]
MAERTGHVLVGRYHTASHTCHVPPPGSPASSTRRPVPALAHTPQAQSPCSARPRRPRASPLPVFARHSCPPPAARRSAVQLGGLKPSVGPTNPLLHYHAFVHRPHYRSPPAVSRSIGVSILLSASPIARARLGKLPVFGKSPAHKPWTHCGH